MPDELVNKNVTVFRITKPTATLTVVFAVIDLNLADGGVGGAVINSKINFPHD